MTRRGLQLITGGLVLVLTAAGGTWWWRAEQRARIISPHLREVPDMSGRSDELQRRASDSRRRARNGSVPALAELSRLYHANGYLTPALACYAALEEVQPDEPRWPHRRAVILAGFGDAEPALARWRRVLALAPDYLAARLRLGDLLLKSNRLDEAAVVYREALQRHRDEPHALLGLARLDVEAGRWHEARERLETVVARTRSALGYDLIVTVYEQLGLHDQAVAVRAQHKASGAYRDPVDPWMNELLEVCFDPYPLAVAGGTAHRGGESAVAIRLLERAVALAPGEVALRFQLAGILAEAGDRPKAREQLELCTKVQPDFADAWAHLAALLEASGDPAAAERMVGAGLGHSPASPGLHLMRARYERRAGRGANAIAAYRRSIELRPNEAEPYVELATLLLPTERASEGIAHLQQALAVEPDHPTALSLLALAAISANDEAGARRWLERVRAQPRIAPAHAGRLYAAFRGQFGREFR